MMWGLCQGDRGSTGDPAFRCDHGVDDCRRGCVGRLAAGERPVNSLAGAPSLLGSPASTVAAERARVATEGWGPACLAAGPGRAVGRRRLLAEVDLHDVHASSSGLAWPSTTKLSGLGGVERLWEWQSRWRVPETCIVSILVRLTAAHGYGAERLEDVVGYLLGQQLDDGGWNCAARGDPGKHSSSTPASWRSRPSTAISESVAERPLMRRSREGESSSCGISCTSPIAPARWQSVAVPASLSCPSGILTFCAGWSTSPMRRRPGRAAGRRRRSRAACPSSGRSVADLCRLSGQDMVPDGGTGSEPVEHRASAARPGLVGRSRLSCWLSCWLGPATLGPCVTW